MAVRRTLKQKQRAEVHRTSVTYELPQSLANKPSTTKNAEETKASMQVNPQEKIESSLSLKLFGYPPRLVYNDLLKTFIVTIIVVAILFTIFTLTR